MSAPVRVRRLILLRHGQTEYNATSRMQGQLDTDLSDLGRRQALTVSHTVADFDPIAIVSSDLRRAYDTATAIGDRAGLPVEIDPRLRETHLGQWQGLTHSEVDARHPGARAQWRGDATWARPAVRVASTSPSGVDPSSTSCSPSTNSGATGRSCSSPTAG